MKKFLPWIKGHIVAVILIAFAIIALPAMIFVSAGMSSSTRDKAQSEVDDGLRDINRISVRFIAPSADPDVPPVEFDRAPNAATIERLKTYIEGLRAQTDGVVEVATERSRAGREPFLEGVFPEPEPSRETALRQEANRAWLDAHVALLDDAEIGAPPSEDEVLRDLQGRRSREEGRLLNLQEEGARLTAEQAAEIAEILVERRLALYRDRALELAFYASPDVFVGVEEWTEQGLPEIEQIWEWQQLLWVHESIIAALVEANLDPLTQLVRRAPSGAVKRVLSIEVDGWDVRFREPSAPAGDISAPIMPDYEASITGRAAFPTRPNPLYDARYATIELIANSAEIPGIVGAFASSNFMTVIDMDLESVDRTEDEAEGYAYGGADHVIKATLQVEVLLLRTWTVDYMPPSVRAALGAPPMEGAEPEQIEMQPEPTGRGGARGRG